MKNAGFETRDIAGWTEWHPRAQKASFSVDTNDPHSGNYKISLWNDTAFEEKISQSKTNLANGLYILRAWVKANGVTPAIGRMVVTSGSTIKTIDVTTDTLWKEYSTQVQVANGRLKVLFHLKSKGSTSMAIDDVQLYPAKAIVPMKNL